MKTAVLVDGGFYRKRAQSKLGDISPIERARELNGYCYKHLSQPDKLARREGIDFILDPLYSPIKDDLFEHIDGLKTCETRFK